MLDIRVIGELRLEGATAALPASRRARALLGWLAVHSGGHHRSRLAGLFWPDVLDASARASLRSAVWALRPALGSCLVTSRDTVSLGGDARVDLREFRRLIAIGQPEAALAFACGQQTACVSTAATEDPLADGALAGSPFTIGGRPAGGALAEVRSADGPFAVRELLQEFDDDWVIEAREEFDREVAAALADLTRRAVRSGEADATLRWARRWAARSPLDESAGATLISALIEAGDAPGAVEAFARLRQRLGTELGVPVSESTAALIAPLLAAADELEPARHGPAATRARSAPHEPLAPAEPRAPGQAGAQVQPGATVLPGLMGATAQPGATDARGTMDQPGVTGATVLPGVTGPVSVAGLRGLAGVAGVPDLGWASSAHAGPAALVGRERQLAELMTVWRSAWTGSGTTVVLAGEGGIGKTRLVQELQARIGAPAVVAGRAIAGPFVVWTEALSELAEMTGLTGMPGELAGMSLTPRAPGDLSGLSGTPSAAREPWVADLARIVPALGRPGPATGDPQLERVRLCEAVVQFLGWAARRSPLLIGFEDIHLADSASLELLAYAGRRIRRIPVLFVLTRRLLPARQQLDATLAALRDRGALAAEIQLGPLDDGAVRRLIATASAAPLTESATARIAGLASGSPLLATELARAADANADFSAGLAGVVRAAIGRLTVPARMFVEFTAAAGRELDRAEVAMLPLPNPAREAAEALGSGLLVAAGGRIGFRHALLADAVYQTIPDPARVRLHAELATVLRKRGGAHRDSAHRDGAYRGGASRVGAGRGGANRAAEIARHFRLAGQDEAAADQLALAARDARRVAAMAAASGFLTEALRLRPDDPELLVELAEVEAFRGLLDGSDRSFDRALELIAPDDSGALVSAWLRRGRWLRGGICHPRESRRSYQNALDVLERDPDDHDAPARAEALAARAEALAGLAWAESVAGDPGAVDALLARVDAIVGNRPRDPLDDVAGDPLGGTAGDLLAHDIGVARGHALIRAGRFTDSFGPLIAASAAAGRAGRPDMAYTCLSNAVCAAAAAGEFDRALDFADRTLALVAPNGLLRLCVYAQVARSAVLRRLGRLSEASKACDAAAGYADKIGLAELDGLVHAERGQLALAGRHPDIAAGELDRALALNAPVSRPATRLLLAQAYALGGKPGLAEAELRNVTLEPVSAADFPATLVARMSRVQGLIASARGDDAQAVRRLRESAAAWRRIAATLDARQAGAGYAAALIDLGRPPVSSLVEPAVELAAVTADLAAVTADLNTLGST